MNRTLKCLLAAALVLPLCACGAHPAFQPVDDLGAHVAEALPAFSIKLLQQAAADEPERNVFLCPASVWLALGMVYNGAGGATAEGIALALQAEGVPPERLNEENRGLAGILTGADPKVQAAVANSLWVNRRDAEGIRRPFLDADRQYYGAVVELLDFGDSGAADVINKWAADNTNGRIRQAVLPDSLAASSLLLANAVYFNAPWKQAFDEADTSEESFFTADGQTTVPFLCRGRGNRGYLDETVTAARLAYGSGRLEFVAVMPNDGDLTRYLATLSPEALRIVVDRCTDTTMALYLPKFLTEYDSGLKPYLSNMGMADAFDSRAADFGKIGASRDGFPLFIGDVGHRAFIEVSEEGTEAAGITVVTFAPTASAPPDGALKDLRFNRPFLYIIRDTVSGAILFLGTVADPSRRSMGTNGAARPS